MYTLVDMIAEQKNDAPLSCTRCEKVFRDTRDLKRHEARKTPCDPVITTVTEGKENTCKHCGRYFASKVSMYRHIRQNCKMVNSDARTDISTDNTIQKQIAEVRAEQQAHCARAEKQMAELASLIKSTIIGQTKVEEIITNAPPVKCKGGRTTKDDPHRFAESDTALVLLATGEWTVMPLQEATLLFASGEAKQIREPCLTYNEMESLPLKARDAIAIANLLYEREKATGEASDK
jgi:uncharacterized C2H2 Zn-finger protein